MVSIYNCDSGQEVFDSLRVISRRCGKISLEMAENWIHIFPKIIVESQEHCLNKKAEKFTGLPIRWEHDFHWVLSNYTDSNLWPFLDTVTILYSLVEKLSNLKNFRMRLHKQFQFDCSKIWWSFSVGKIYLQSKIPCKYFDIKQLDHCFHRRLRRFSPQDSWA